MQQTLGRSRQLGIKLYEFTPLYNHMYTSYYLFEMICNIRRTGWSRGLRWTNMASKPWWRLSQADQSGDVVWIYSLEKENRLPFVSEGETAYKGCRSGAYDHMSSANCNTPRKVVSWTHRLSTICFWSMLPCHAQCIPGNWQIHQIQCVEYVEYVDMLHKMCVDHLLDWGSITIRASSSVGRLEGHGGTHELMPTSNVGPIWPPLLTQSLRIVPDTVLKVDNYIITFTVGLYDEWCGQISYFDLFWLCASKEQDGCSVWVLDFLQVFVDRPR